MSCNDTTVNTRPIGIGYNSQGEAANLTELTTASVSALNTMTISPSVGSIVYIYGALSAASYLGTGGGSVTTLDDLSDVTITSPTNGDVLRFNGISWVNSTTLTTAESTITSHTTSITNLTTSTINNATRINTVSSFAIAVNDELANHEADLSVHFGDVNGPLRIDTPTTNDYLTYDGANWVNSQLQSYALSNHTHSFSALSGEADVLITTPTTFQTLTYNGSKWVNSSIPALNTTLAGLTGDVLIPAPTMGQVLTWNGSSKWIASTIPQANTSLAGLTTDVQLTSPTTGQYLTYNGSKWVSSSLDTTLFSMGQVTTAANTLIYFTGVDAAASASFTNAGRNFASCSSTLAAGDIFYYDGFGLVKVAVGSIGAILCVNSTNKPQWGSVTSGAAGSMYIFNGTTIVDLPPGTNGQTLKMVGGLPQWSS